MQDHIPEEPSEGESILLSLLQTQNKDVTWSGGQGKWPCGGDDLKDEQA